ncbi:transient receptor potential cation channel protein painless-like [Nilaparvata lugens]|uniref:transient receptor potential cation channel protein painless-like n=1 Tax=Nilaparvata lugens TaxID=108931 RepID=UPI00193D780F|nr:transient receptor potential cation channel protein painless-like [Nilaparvata lugens]
MADDTVELTDKGLARTGSLCSPDPHDQLLTAFNDRDFDNFQKILTTGVKNAYVDPNFWFDDPNYCTLLDLACRKSSSSQYVRCLLSCGADPNKINSVRKKSPIHFAVELGDISIVNLLLHDNRTDVNKLDGTGSTALHAAARSSNVDVMIALLGHPKINPNIANRKGLTPIHVAVIQGTKEAVLCLLQHQNIDPKSATDLILESFPNLEPKLPTTGNTVETLGKSNNLFNLLHKHDEETFVRAIQINTDSINDNDGLHTFLQYACDFGMFYTVGHLLRLGADPNGTHTANRTTPIMLASYKGYYNIVRLLVQNDCTRYNPINGETVLHCVIKGSTDLHVSLGASKEDRDHYKCMEVLLRGVPGHKLNINCGDVKGNTPLHYAAKLNNKEFILLLLSSGAYVGQRNTLGEPALADVSPKIFEKYLDDCLTTNDKLPREDNYEIIFRYNFLAPPKVQKHEDLTSSRAMLQIESNMKGVDEPTDQVISETEPLLYMSRSSDLRPLLKHPVLTSFLHLKWHRIRCFFYCNLTFYIFFWMFLTAYILTAYAGMRPEGEGNDKINTNTTSFNKTLMKRSTQETIPETIGDEFKFFVLWLLVALSLVVLILRELFQLTVSPLRYFANPENWLEVCLIGVTLSILFCRSCVNSRHQISAVAILLSWAELVLLIGRHPALSTNIEMLKTVSWNFLKFLAWYSILIIAFALSFFTLFSDSETEGDENFFVDPATSVFKTVVMLTGEFDAGSIPFVNHPGTSHVLFVLFVFLIAIVLFNLLNGLAVSDTQSIRADAELVGYVSRVKLVTYVESLVMGTPTPYRGFINKIQKLFCCLPRLDCCMVNYGCLRIFSHRINLFPDLYPDCEVRILPNQASRIEMFSRGHKRKRQEIEEESESLFYDCYTMTMDPVIVRSAKEILVKKLEAKELQSRGDPYTILEACCKDLNNYTKTLNQPLTSETNPESSTLVSTTFKSADNSKLILDLSRRLDEYKLVLDRLVRNSEKTEYQMNKLIKQIEKSRIVGSSSSDDNQ